MHVRAYWICLTYTNLFHSDKASSRLAFLHLQTSKRYGLTFEKLFKLSTLHSWIKNVHTFFLGIFYIYFLKSITLWNQSKYKLLKTVCYFVKIILLINIITCQNNSLDKQKQMLKLKFFFFNFFLMHIRIGIEGFFIFIFIFNASSMIHVVHMIKPEPTKIYLIVHLTSFIVVTYAFWNAIYRHILRKCKRAIT